MISGDGMLLLTPLLKKYLEMGLVVTDIECVIEYNGKSVFKWFMDKVCDDRRRADIDPDFKVIGETSKLKGNSGYGASIMDRSKHTMVSFTEEKNISKHISNPFFKTMEELSGGVYEVEKLKKSLTRSTYPNRGSSIQLC